MKKMALIKLADSNKKGKAFVNELNKELSPSKIASRKGNDKFIVAQKNKKPMKKYGC